MVRAANGGVLAVTSLLPAEKRCLDLRARPRRFLTVLTREVTHCGFTEMGCCLVRLRTLSLALVEAELVVNRRGSGHEVNTIESENFLVGQLSCVIFVLVFCDMEIIFSCFLKDIFA